LRANPLVTSGINAAWHKRHVMPRNPTVAQRMAWHRAHQEHCRCRPLPAKLLEQMRASPRDRRSLRRLLAGGDRRSLARSERARALAETSPRRIRELAALAEDGDQLVSMRAIDLLEKLAHDRPDLVQPHKRLFIGRLADSEVWETRLQIVRALPLLSWTGRERDRVIEILRRDLGHPRKFVRAWALDSLAVLAQEDPALTATVAKALRSFGRSGSKSLVTRARHIRDRLERG
jgi:hypothetical protein